MLKVQQNGKLSTSSNIFIEQVSNELDMNAMPYMLVADRSQNLEDYETANEYYKKAEGCGMPKPLRCLGINYFFVDGVEENADTALKYFKKYFELVNKEQDYILDFDYAYAGYLTGLIYDYEKDDNDKALKYFIKGADLDYPPCQYYAGLFFTYKKDLNNAFEYLMKAVENGYVPALIEVGKRCHYGICGFEKSFEASVNYHTQVIEAGTDNANLMLV